MARERLWLCLHFPRLPLEVLGEAGATTPLAVLDADPPAQIVICNVSAQDAGLRTGMSVNAAQALLPRLRLLPRDTMAEAEALRRLADETLAFTDHVSLVSPAALLAEIGGSQRLFGAPSRIAVRLRAACAELGHEARVAVAPWPRAAFWLAQAGRERIVTAVEHLAGQLAELPIASLPWPATRREALRSLGVRSLGDCVRLPRAALARRFGSDCLLELDQAHGRAADPRPRYQPEPVFAGRVEMPLASTDLGQLGGAIEQLLRALQQRLRQRQRTVQCLWLTLEHARRPASLLRLGLLRETADVRSLLALWRLQLEASGLPAEVVALALRARLCAASSAPAGELFPVAGNAGRPADEAGLEHLLERLRARLGRRAIQRLGIVAEHRPEYASQALSWRSRSARIPTADWPPRPAWLLAKPQRLASREGRPLQSGPLELLRGPERIESGWWDGRDIRRDYYVARSRPGRLLWLYRDLRDGHWYLHGLFG